MGAIVRKKPASMNTGSYHIVASIIRTLPDELKQPVANHFATEFNKRSKSFDPTVWERWTGGKPAPNSAR